VLVRLLDGEGFSLRSFAAAARSSAARVLLKVACYNKQTNKKTKRQKRKKRENQKEQRAHLSDKLDAIFLLKSPFSQFRSSRPVFSVSKLLTAGRFQIKGLEGLLVRFLLYSSR
jgi:hypothetical protein